LRGPSIPSPVPPGLPTDCQGLGNTFNLDFPSSVDLSYQLSGTLRLGIEAMGQDLEGFWDQTEAEGGERLYFGPVAGAVVPGTPWNLTVGGGPIIRDKLQSYPPFA